ncbi:hypothetical protein [Larkinella terrae]|uniref:Uncharacterized protein n=1 Tax=Larkinella terrae TaxID=2025311 RepID=A0A7K0EIJ9_9BACT|nr:hypothetical protein [Larkinella terrae]MRS61669.1 hypothetical protein [Larkinella terrae]
MKTIFIIAQALRLIRLSAVVRREFPEWNGKRPNELIRDYCDHWAVQVALDEMQRYEHVVLQESEGRKPDPWQPLRCPPLYLRILRYKGRHFSKLHYVQRTTVETIKAHCALVTVWNKNRELSQLPFRTQEELNQYIDQRIMEAFINAVPENRRN